MMDKQIMGRIPAQKYCRWPEFIVIGHYSVPSFKIISTTKPGHAKYDIIFFLIKVGFLVKIL